MGFREAGWHFFIKRWSMMLDAVSGVAAAAQQAPQAVNQAQVARLDIVLKKAVRARSILQQLQEYGDRQQQLELRFRPVVQQLPTLLEQLRPEELSKAAEFAVTEGMRQPIMQLTGSSASSVAAAQAADPFGIRIALRPGHPLALLTWQQYSALIRRIATVVEQQLAGPALEALQAFHRERKLLVSELQVLRQQLEPEVQLPQLEPLRDETDRLEQLLQALWQLQDAHVHMLRKDLCQLNLELLELKLKLKLSDSFQGSQLQAALKRLRRVQEEVLQQRQQEQQEQRVVLGGQQQWQAMRLPFAAWAQLEEDLKVVVDNVRERQRLEQQLDVNIQRYESLMFQKLSQLQGAGQQRL